MSAHFDSPFLDQDGPWPRDDEREKPSGEAEGPFAELPGEAGSPFLPGEVEQESQFLSGEANGAEYEANDPALFVGGELERAIDQEWQGLAPEDSREGEGEGEAEGETEGGAGDAPYGEGEGEGEGDGSAELEGEIIVLSREAEYEEAERGGAAAVFADEEAYPAEEGQLPQDAFPVLGRILWPALGFPAVVTPAAAPKKEPSFDVDATRCLTLLVLTNTPKLPAAEAARRLRIVPWAQRGRRFIPDGKPGAFAAADLAVRTDSQATKLTLAQPKDATEDRKSVV